MKSSLRIAYFPDSFLEVDGVATTSKRLLKFVKKNKLPFICVHAGNNTELIKQGNLKYLTLKRSPFAIRADQDLRYDPLFFRHVNTVKRTLEQFKPDIIHITGLNDVSNIGAYLAWKMNLPLIASWHTNLHQYAALRLRKVFGFLPKRILEPVTAFLEQKILDGAALYYKMPQVILAPNEELIDILEKATGRKGRLMLRGVDTEIFSPGHRTVNDSLIRFGFVGRLRAEKNVRMLTDIESRLLKAGKTNIRFLIIGEGPERKYLEKNLKKGEFTGFLYGKQLSEAYANMDVLLFPSETDSFGNVVQEANASGLPGIVTNKGGPRFIVQEGKTGFVAKTPEDFVQRSIELIDNPSQLLEMKKNSLEFAKSRSWDFVFEMVYEAYLETKEYRDAKKDRERRK